MLDLLEELYSVFIEAFDFVFDWASSFIFSLFGHIFDGCENRGASLLSAIDNMLAKVSFSNFIVFFFGFIVSLFLFKFAMKLLQLARG